MKRTKIFMLAAIAAILTTACEKEKKPNDPTDDGKVKPKELLNASTTSWTTVYKQTEYKGNTGGLSGKFILMPYSADELAMTATYKTSNYTQGWIGFFNPAANSGYIDSSYESLPMYPPIPNSIVKRSNGDVWLVGENHTNSNSAYDNVTYPICRNKQKEGDAAFASQIITEEGILSVHNYVAWLGNLPYWKGSLFDFNTKQTTEYKFLPNQGYAKIDILGVPLGYYSGKAYALALMHETNGNNSRFLIFQNEDSVNTNALPNFNTGYTLSSLRHKAQWVGSSVYFYVAESFEGEATNRAFYFYKYNTATNALEQLFTTSFSVSSLDFAADASGNVYVATRDGISKYAAGSSTPQTILSSSDFISDLQDGFPVTSVVYLNGKLYAGVSAKTGDYTGGQYFNNIIRYNN